jgi:hypothetical protein
MKVILSLLFAIQCAAYLHVPTAVKHSTKLEAKVDSFGKYFGMTAIVLGLAGPQLLPSPVHADGAVSASSVYRARNYYGNKIKDLYDDVMKGNFAAFEQKKILNAFDLFISESNAQKSTIAKERKSAELALQAKIYDAVKNKDRGQLSTSYGEFIKVADLTSDYKPGEPGQTDSSGNSPTYGTAREQIYRR